MKQRRHGFFLMEMIITLALITIVVGMAMRVFASDIRTGTELSVAERNGTALHQMLHTLRLDVENADAPHVDNTALDAGSVRWTTERYALIRTVGGHVDRFDVSASPSFERSHGLVVLHLGQDELAFAPLVTKGLP